MFNTEMVTRELPVDPKRVTDLLQSDERTAFSGRAKFESHGGGNSIEVSRMRRAVRSAEEAGVELPKSLHAAFDKLAAVTALGQQEPQVPDAASDDFVALAKQYAVDHAVWATGGESRRRLVDEVLRVLRQEILGAGDAVLTQLRERFDAAGEEFRAAHERLRVLDLRSLQDAAEADGSGAAVALWHQRARAAGEMTKVVDVVRAFTGSDSHGTVSLVSPVPVTLRNMLSQTTGEQRYREIIDAGYPLQLAESRAVLRSRSAEIDDDE